MDDTNQTQKRVKNQEPTKSSNLEQEAKHRYEVRRRESSLVKKIVFSILFTGFLLLLVVGFVGYNYVMESLRPLDEKNEELVEIEIPMGTSTKGIAQLLEDQHIVKDATVFNYYMKTQNAPQFQAGFYQLSPAMELDEIITVLTDGGNPTPQSEDFKILVKEGASVEEIAEEFAAKTDYSKDDFLNAVKDQAFLKKLQAEFPTILSDAIFAETVKYPLEGYLFPATYDYLSDRTPEDMIRLMVQKADEVLKPYNKQVEATGLSLHQVLTMASLVEKEGVTYEDRQVIAGVFYNRLADDMPIQSDISISYAKGEHLEYVAIADTEVDSPYNLYQNKGLGPGPFNNPSEAAIKAVLAKVDTPYYYFLADLTTGEVYFSETFEQHLELQEQYVPSEE